MKNILFILALLLSVTSFAQTKQFQDLTNKTKQSYLDRGYTLVNFSGDSITTAEPLVTPMIDLDYNTYYIVLVQIDGCVYCNYDINFVDDQEFLFPIEHESITENGLKQGIVKFQNDTNKIGKYVLFLDSDLPYYANIFIFAKK